VAHQGHARRLEAKVGQCTTVENACSSAIHAINIDWHVAGCALGCFPSLFKSTFAWTCLDRGEHTDVDAPGLDDAQGARR